jgi:hypothetical protein
MHSYDSFPSHSTSESTTTTLSIEIVPLKLVNLFPKFLWLEQMEGVLFPKDWLHIHTSLRRVINEETRPSIPASAISLPRFGSPFLHLGRGSVLDVL